MENKDQITYFADTDARNRRVRFGIKAGDRTRHVYVIGKTGMGKSVLLENMAAQDIRNGNGFAFIDPHGQTADILLEYIPKERVKDVLYFAPFDIEYPISFNIMEDVGYDKRHLVVSGLMSTFKKIWVDAWSARMEYILGNTLLSLLEYPDSTLLDVNRMLSDKTFRNKVVANITDPSVKSFWVDEFAKYTDRYAADAVPAIQNKIGQFTSNPLIRNIIGQPDSTFDIRDLMDTRKILIINLSKGRIGEQNANLLGSMLITKIYLAAMSRADAGEAELKQLPNFYLYVDEFQSFANESFANILSEARKYKLNLTIAHQYIEQMTDEVRAAVFGNVGTLISFRVGSYDAEVLEKEFAPTFTAQDIVNLGAYQIYLRLMINGIGSQPFSARTIPPLEKPQNSPVEEIRKASRDTFARPRQQVEDLIKKNLMGDEVKVNNTQDGSKTIKSDSNNKNDNNRKNNNGNGYSGNGSNGNGNGGTPKNQNNSQKPRQNKVIDEKTRLELEKALHFNANQDQEKDNKEISLKEISNNDKKVDFVKKSDDKGPKIENSNALRDALAEALKKKEEIVKIEIKKEVNKIDIPKIEIVKEIVKAPETVSELKLESKPETKPEVKVEVKTETKINIEQKTEKKPEISERELKEILGVE
jgi:hypothetical protein